MTEHQGRAAEQLLEEVRTTLGVLWVVLTWVGVALLIVAFVLGSGFARRVGGAGYLSLKQFHSRRRRRWPWMNEASRDWLRETA
jgi:hypothetical protein